MVNETQVSSLQPLRPSIAGPADPPQSFFPTLPVQFRPMLPAQQSQPRVPMASQQFQPFGQDVSGMNMGLPSQSQQFQFSQPMQQLPAEPGQPSHGPMPYLQGSRPTTSTLSQSCENVPTFQSHNHDFGGTGLHPSSVYAFVASSQIPPQLNASAVVQYQSEPQIQPPTVVTITGELPKLSPKLLVRSQVAAAITPVHHGASVAACVPPNLAPQDASVWLEHTSADGRRYYFNKKMRQSTWEKPLELMTPIERADASTPWKEYTSPAGRKYYYNKITKQSKWTIPEELKLAREQVEAASTQGVLLKTNDGSSVSQTVIDASSSVVLSLSKEGATPSPVSVASVAAPDNLQPSTATILSAFSVVASERTNAVDIISPKEAPSPVATNAGGAGVPISGAAVDKMQTATTLISSALSVVAMTRVTNAVEINTQNEAPSPVAADAGSDGTSMSNLNSIPVDNVLNPLGGVSTPSMEEAMAGNIAATIKSSSLGAKTVDQGHPSYVNKQEAKNAFVALLESAKVESNWTWEQAMRVIINDRRYGALKSLGERKQAFSEFVDLKKKQEAEDWRVKQKFAGEEFKKMLKESRNLKSSMKWSEAIAIFENDERFQAVKQVRDREDLLRNYLAELEKKERVKASEEYRRNIVEYRQFLESCDFIKASSQWRKVKDRLEADERCFCLKMFHRVEVFQEYIQDLEKEEEEQKRLQKVKLRKVERKNRDEFWKLMEGHVVDGSLTAKTHWADYLFKVKGSPEYQAVVSNASGSTPKDLFEDVAQELQKQYREDKSRIKDALNLGKVTLSSTWTLEDFKAGILPYTGNPPPSDINLKLAFNELLERAREKEEKEAKKLKLLADEFINQLQSTKEISVTSKWEECKSLIQGWHICRSFEDETIWREIFEDYVTHLKEQIEESEQKRMEGKDKRKKEKGDRERAKEKHGGEMDGGHGRTRGEEKIKQDGTHEDAYAVMEENRSLGKGKDKKHRKRHQSASNDVIRHKDRKNSSKSTHRDDKEHKKFRHMKLENVSPKSDSESKHKRPKRLHLNCSRHDNYDEHDNGEIG